MSSPSNNNDALQQQQDQQAQQEAQRQATINTGMSNLDNIFGSYNSDYYNGLSNQYSQYYDPQASDQYNQAAQQLLYSQANQGILNSSAGGYENSQLSKQNAQQNAQIASSAQDYANNAQSQVQTLRNNLTNQLQSTGDDSAITPAALNQLNIQSVSSMTPLQNLFGNITSLYGNYSANTAATGQNNILNSGISSLFGGQTGSSSSGGSVKNGIS